MSGLEERLRKAVGAHLPLDPHHLTPAFTRDAIVAACKVLAEEFGPRPEDAAPVVKSGVGEGFPQVQGKCPACGGASLFLGKDGHVTCAWLDCGNPAAADEVLGDPPAARTAAPPVRELPTEPGAVVLATKMFGVPCRRPVLLVRTEDEGDGEPWLNPGVKMDRAGRWLAPGDITDHIPATVVTTAVHEAAVKALRDVLTDVFLAEGKDIDRDDALDQIEERCKAALAVIEGATT